jgi:SpoVK/Ycf46/Vps4 family AAA+-type ATPase
VPWRQRLGLPLYFLGLHALPASIAELHQFQRLWEREFRLSSAALLLDCDDAAADLNREAAIGALIENLDGPLIVIARERRQIKRRPSSAFEVSRTGAGEQRSAWLAAFNGGAQGDSPNFNGQVELLASQFSLTLTQIRSATREAGHPADSDFDILWDACRNQTRSQLEDMAQRIESRVSWDDLVLPETQKDILRDIVAQVKHRSTVYETWGFGGKGTRGLGISVLFAGGSGTGKTMAAEVLAGALRLDLYRIDLSSLVSKYIGETEKNLRRVFDAAEAGGAILLFDEADALFGKRSEVRDSHDRYANIEVSYLLQRMESYRGLAILTTNMKSALDTAFLRRIRFVVQFPFPDAAQRADIWRRIIPKTAPAQALDVEKLAQLNVAGGNIRNMALTAAFLAADSGEPIHMAHVLRAARAEYAKLEKPLTDAEIAGWIHTEETVAD